MNRDWISHILGGLPPVEGEHVVRNGIGVTREKNIVRDVGVVEERQAQTRDMFAFKWQQRDTYASQNMKEAQIVWLNSRYEGRSLLEHWGGTDTPTVLDAGCGSGFSAELVFAADFNHIRYVGADISEAVDIAAEVLGTKIPDSFFIQADLTKLPFSNRSFDIIVSEGVLHHTPSTKEALLSLVRLLKPAGIIAFYIYNKKAPVREFTDDYIREKIADLPPEQAWKMLEPLTRFGIALGEMNAHIDVPEDVPLLGIKKGRHNIQRLFYWTICKMYYRPEFSLDEMNHINFDWFTPKYCHRQTPEEVMSWCIEAGLDIEHIKVEEAGITVVARNPDNV